MSTEFSDLDFGIQVTNDSHIWSNERDPDALPTANVEEAIPSYQASLGSSQVTIPLCSQQEANTSTHALNHFGQTAPNRGIVLGSANFSQLMPMNPIISQQQQIDHDLTIEDERHKRRRKEIIQQHQLPHGVLLTDNLHANTHPSSLAAISDPNQSPGNYQLNLGHPFPPYNHPVSKEGLSGAWFPENTSASFTFQPDPVLSQRSTLHSEGPTNLPYASDKQMLAPVQQYQTFSSFRAQQSGSFQPSNFDHMPYDSHPRQRPANMGFSNPGDHEVNPLLYNRYDKSMQPLPYRVNNARGPVTSLEDCEMQLLYAASRSSIAPQLESHISIRALDRPDDSLDNPLRMIPNATQHVWIEPNFGPQLAQEEPIIQNDTYHIQVPQIPSGRKRYCTPEALVNDTCNKLMQMGKVNASLDLMCFYTNPEAERQKPRPRKKPCKVTRKAESACFRCQITKRKCIRSTIGPCDQCRDAVERHVNKHSLRELRCTPVTDFSNISLFLDFPNDPLSLLEGMPPEDGFERVREIRLLAIVDILELKHPRVIMDIDQPFTTVAVYSYQQSVLKWKEMLMKILPCNDVLLWWINKKAFFRTCENMQSLLQLSSTYKDRLIATGWLAMAYMDLTALRDERFVDQPSLAHLLSAIEQRLYFLCSTVFDGEPTANQSKSGFAQCVIAVACISEAPALWPSILLYIALPSPKILGPIPKFTNRASESHRGPSYPKDAFRCHCAWVMEATPWRILKVLNLTREAYFEYLHDERSPCFLINRGILLDLKYFTVSRTYSRLITSITRETATVVCVVFFMFLASDRFTTALKDPKNMKTDYLSLFENTKVMRLIMLSAWEITKICMERLNHLCECLNVDHVEDCSIPISKMVPCEVLGGAIEAYIIKQLDDLLSRPAETSHT